MTEVDTLQLGDRDRGHKKGTTSQRHSSTEVDTLQVWQGDRDRGDRNGTASQMSRSAGCIQERHENGTASQRHSSNRTENSQRHRSDSTEESRCVEVYIEGSRWSDDKGQIKRPHHPYSPFTTAQQMRGMEENLGHNVDIHDDTREGPDAGSSKSNTSRKEIC